MKLCYYMQYGFGIKLICCMSALKAEWLRKSPLHKKCTVRSLRSGVLMCMLYLESHIRLEQVKIALSILHSHSQGKQFD